MPTTIKSPKAAPKKVAAKKAVVAAASSSKVAPEVQELRDAFAAYQPNLQIIQHTYTVAGLAAWKAILPGTKTAKPVIPDEKWQASGLAPYSDVRSIVIDFNTLTTEEGKVELKAMPFWWQVEQGLHPVLPQVKDLAKFMTDWINDCSKAQEMQTSVYTGHHSYAEKKFRFSEQKSYPPNAPAGVKPYIPSFQCITHHYLVGRFKALYNLVHSNVAVQILDPLVVPKTSPDEAKALVAKAAYTSNSFITEAPSVLEFEDNQAMYDKVMEHCAQIPGFKIHYLRKMMVAYTSDGPMENHPTAFNKDGHKTLLYNANAPSPSEVLICATNKKGYTALKHSSVPIIYVGECWAINFSFFNDYHACAGNMVYFAEWKDFVATYEKYRPDEIATVPEFTDLVFICSHWCERDSARNYGGGKGIELQTPVTRQLSLRNWIVGPFLEHTLRNTKLDGVNSYSGAMTMKKLEIAEAAVKKVTAEAGEIKPKMTPLWADHFKSKNAPEPEAAAEVAKPVKKLAAKKPTVKKKVDFNEEGKKFLKATVEDEPVKKLVVKKTVKNSVVTL